MEFKHTPVLFKECINLLNIKEDGIYVDCTVGGGGHSLGIVERLTTGRLIINDVDDEALIASKAKLSRYMDKISSIKGEFKNIVEGLAKLGVTEVDGFLIDLGISSHQIDDSSRGFSYMQDAALDMRMDQTSNFSAYNVINEYSVDSLTEIFREYGEEKFAFRIANAIVKKREKKKIESTKELASIIIENYPKKFDGGHPAKRCFQAIRIEVNDEIDNLSMSIYSMVKILKSGGRMAIISFHSLEDRIIKKAFKDLNSDCVCDKSLPICVCGKTREVVMITGKPITASEDELIVNPRSASAKLRVIEKI
ncbi:MAG: 16S rRNA (cytosine(1402)-N(4))-methyltransferase RsmH [Christensenellaceae bacterium]|nr:16S rRNA (cytosine(1402)-N(4))-methyltransferase RsmH [Christensenellaceae bacterium]